MGAYAYCECGQPMDKPTIREIVLGEQPCPSCRKDRYVDREELVCLLVDLNDRVEALENKGD